MANQVVSVVSQKVETIFDFIFVNSVFNIGADTNIKYIDTTISEIEVLIKYEEYVDAGAPASYIHKERKVHIDGVSWINLPGNHKVTVALYQDDSITKRDDNYMDTKDSPILR